MTLAAVSAPGASEPNDALQAWLSQNAVTVRSIDAADENFSDLEPLISAIGDARVVQLGEPSHGAGSSFAAKVRLIKFLHQRMGFDVVAWESGLFDVRLAQAAMRAGDDAVAAAQQGILAVWSATEEVRPLFEYAKASQASGRPLDMAGFDMQTSAANVSDRFAADLRSFVPTLRDPALRKNAGALVEQIISAHQRLFARSEALRRFEADAVKAARSGKAPAQSPGQAIAAWEKTDAAKLGGRKQDIETLERTTDSLLALIRNHRAAFLTAHGVREITFMERAIENLRGNDRNVYERERPDRPAGAAASALFVEGWNRRDALNAKNLRWLIQEGYPGRKLIVWAHNVHLMNAYYAADVGSIHVESQPGGLEPSGVALAKWLQDDVYTIAMTSYAGEDGWNNANTIAPAAEGSLESRLHQLGKPYVFLDFRAVDDSPNHSLRKPISLRIDRYRDDTLTDITRAFDAVFYVDRMAPAKSISE